MWSGDEEQYFDKKVAKCFRKEVHPVHIEDLFAMKQKVILIAHKRYEWLKKFF